MRPLAPKLVKDGEGGDAWLYNDGGAPAPLGLVTVTRDRTREELRWGGARYDTINQGNFEAKARVEEMLEDGVVAEVIYSPQRTMRHFMQGTENDIHLAGVRAYNDWLAKDFCAKAPDRLIGIAQMPATGVEDAIAEMRRSIDMGLRGVLVSSWPSGNANVSEADDPFFAEAQKLGIPVSLHIGLVSRAKAAPKPRTPVTSTRRTPRRPAPAAARSRRFRAPASTSMPLLLGEIILTGVHDRFPKLKFVSVEAGIGWVPYYAEQMDDRYERNRHWAKIKLGKRLPSEYVKSQLDVHLRARPLRRGEPPRDRRRQHHVVDRLPASRLRLAALAQDRRGHVRGRPRDGAPADHLRQRGPALRHPRGRDAAR